VQPYVQPYYYPQKEYVEERTDKVVVVNRLINIHPQPYAKVENPEVDKVVADVISEIPIPVYKLPERVFKFAATQLPMAEPIQRVEYKQAAAATQTETKILYGQIKQGIAVHNNHVIVADDVISISNAPVKREIHTHRNDHK
jgi:hypothetical protein